MLLLRDTVILAYLILQYVLFHLGWGKPPEVQRFYHPGISALDALLGWRRKTRFVGAEHCPVQGPAIVAGNHIEIDDPFVMGNAIYWFSDGRVRPYAMMRDDFFRGMSRWLKRIIDPDEVCAFIGAILIKRQGAETAQLLPFVRVLREGGVFLIYPGRSRSRSGMFIDYREWIHSPGATAFFVTNAQEGCREPTVPTIPVTRTCNPVTGRSTIIFGKPMYLDPSVDRAGQREFDFALVMAMSDLIEINVPQVVSALLYLHCLHGRPETLPLQEIRDSVRRVFSEISGRCVDPAAAHDPDGEVERMLRFLEAKKMLKRTRGAVRLNRDRILFAPRSLSLYRAQNPVKHLANQIIHLGDVVRSIERAVLG